MSKSLVSRPTPGDRICRTLTELPGAYRDNCYFTHIYTDKVSCPPKAELNDLIVNDLSPGKWAIKKSIYLCF